MAVGDSTTKLSSNGWTNVQATRDKDEAESVPKGSGNSNHIERHRVIRRCKSGDGIIQGLESLDSRSSHDTSLRRSPLRNGKKSPKTSKQQRKRCKSLPKNPLGSWNTSPLSSDDTVVKGPGMKRLGGKGQKPIPIETAELDVTSISTQNKMYIQRKPTPLDKKQTSV